MTKIQKKVDDFTKKCVLNNTITEFRLSDYKGQWVLLHFFPLAFTFVCPTEIVAYSNRADEFKKRNTQVAFISVDSEYSLLKWTEISRNNGGLGSISIPLISDLNHSLSKQFDVLLDEGVALRGSFLIDNMGVLRQITINDLPVGRSVDESLRLIDAFQFTDKHGEVCPANWEKGSKTIKPDVLKSKEYFKTLN